MNRFFKIIISIKQVPDTTNIQINPKTNTLIREGVASIINPFDMYAIEEGLRIAENYEGMVVVISMGPPQVEEALREAISMGADRACLLSDQSFAGSDTLATAYTLAAGIRKLGGADIILLGRQAIDGDTGQVGPGIAENLGIPHITDVRKIETIDSEGVIVVERMLEGGYIRIKTRMPVLLTVVKEINEPRLPSLKGKLRAKKENIQVWGLKDLHLVPDRVGLIGSPTQVVRIFTPPMLSGGKVFKGDVRQAVKRLLAGLEKEGISVRNRGKGHGDDSGN
jgi:electron transfer flavoprotein beta subunit